MDIELCTTSGIERIDNILRGLINLCEASFPARIRSYYLGGSYSDGTAVGHSLSPNSSDVDLFVIFRGTVKQAEHATFHSIITECQLNSPIQVDAHAYSEDDLLHQPRPKATQTSFLNALIQVASVHVYGDDIRALLPLVPFSRYVLDVIESGVFHLSIPRPRQHIAYPLVTPLVPPLAYPNPAGEFYGYDIVPARPDAPHGTRVLVAITAWIATLILALETGRYAGQKSQCMRLCKEYLPNNKRTQLVTTIYDTCKGKWGYALPVSAADRELFCNLCHDTLSLENEYLQLSRNYILAQLHQGGTAEKQQATHILQSVAYRDNEIVAALKALANTTDEAVRTGATKALEITERNS